jgi:hypothetical protein
VNGQIEQNVRIVVWISSPLIESIKLYPLKPRFENNDEFLKRLSEFVPNVPLSRIADMTIYTNEMEFSSVPFPLKDSGGLETLEILIGEIVHATLANLSECSKSEGLKLDGRP